MKKTICRKEYDTDRAELVKRHISGYFGDPAGFEEMLCKTPDGFFFLHVRGGEKSPYPNEDIIRMGKAKAQEWMDQH